MSAVMLISNRRCAELRLRSFTSADDVIGEVANWEWMGSYWYKEGIGLEARPRCRLKDIQLLRRRVTCVLGEKCFEDERLNDF